MSLCFQSCSGFLSPEKLLAERVFLLRRDLSRGKSWSLQRLSQPLGQQSRAVPVQTQQDLREMLRQAAGSAASHRLTQQMKEREECDITICVCVCRDWPMSESPAGRSPSAAFHPPATPQRAEVRPSTEVTAPSAHRNIFNIWNDDWDNDQLLLFQLTKKKLAAFTAGVSGNFSEIIPGRKTVECIFLSFFFFSV